MTEKQLTRKQKEQYLQELELLYQEKARRNLEFFCKYVMPNYEVVEKIHRPIINLLIRVLNGEVKKAIINIPPRAGKSQLISQLFPAFVLGNSPKTKIVTASYNSDLAADMSRGAKGIVESEQFSQLFPNWKYGDKKEGLYWEAQQGGHYYAVGVGGGLTGKGYDIGIIDDPVKDREEAESETIQRRIWNWYRSVFTTRKQDQNSAVILMQTRRHTNDLAGLIMEQEGEKWEKLVIPAIDEDGNELIRPGKWDEGYFHELKNEIGPYDFAALFQQTPYIEGDGVFKNEWFQYYEEEELEHRRLRIVSFVDPAIGKNQDNDNTAIVTVGIDLDSNFIYVIDVYADRMGPEDIYENIFRIHHKYNPEKIGIESNQFQKHLIFEVNQQMRMRNQYFVLDDINQKGEKEARIKATLSPRYARGTILHPNSSVIEPLEKELLAFPKGKHDDRIDALSSAISLLNVKNIRDNSPNIITSDYSRYV